MSKIFTQIIILLLRFLTPSCFVTPPPTGYIRYEGSTGLNVILSAPHGGSAAPSDIPDRDAGCWDGKQCIWTHSCGQKDTSRCGAVTVTDMYTIQLVDELRTELCRRCGKCPASVINLLSRKKLDANREVHEATFSVPTAVLAFNEYHNFIQTEKNKVPPNMRGLFIDIHRQGHDLLRAELGYLLTAKELNSNKLNANETCIYGLYKKVGGSFDSLLRGVDSFGGLLEKQGFESVPSPTNPGPGNNPYFNGGYNVLIHGSLNGGNVDAIQIETQKSFQNGQSMAQYVQALATTIAEYLGLYYDSKVCT